MLLRCDIIIYIICCSVAEMIMKTKVHHVQYSACDKFNNIALYCSFNIATLAPMAIIITHNVCMCIDVSCIFPGEGISRMFSQHAVSAFCEMRVEAVVHTMYLSCLFSCNGGLEAQHADINQVSKLSTFSL